MPQKANTADPRRVVCHCRSSRCYKGVYIDAYGNSKRGVKVLLATKEAHERADLRSQIQGLSLLPSEDPPNSSGLPAIDSRNHLIDSLSNLGLGSESSREHAPARGAPRRCSTPTVPDSNENQYNHAHVLPDISASITSQSAEDSNRRWEAINKSTNPSTSANLRNNTHILDPDVSVAALIAREKGLHEYDCSKFLSLIEMNV